MPFAAAGSKSPQSIQDDRPGGPIEWLLLFFKVTMAAVAGKSVHRSSIRSPLCTTTAPAARREWPWAGAALISVILSVGWADSKEPGKSVTAEGACWRVGKPVPIAVQHGRAIFRAPASTPGSEILVVASALSREKGPFSVQLTARPATSASVPSLAADGLPGCARRPAECPPPRQTADLEREHADPGRPRVFHILVRDGDVYSPSNYVAVPAVLRGVGRRIQVYVAREDLDPSQPIRSATSSITFDDRIFPLMSSRFGPAPDVDGDGRFTVLLSSWLDHLGGGRFAVDGFVRVADLDCSFRPPLGNQCDVMYLSTALQSGPYLRNGAGT